MGATVVDAVNAAEGMEVVAALDEGDALASLESASCQVVVDFTTPDAVILRWNTSP
jgi:4-hydroxy-tetrahydrodipicolinate reductase